MCLTLEKIYYTGDRALFLEQVESALNRDQVSGEFLFRATEAEHLWKIFKYGTDRSGFPGKKIWKHSTSETVIHHEDVIIGATRTKLLESSPDLPTLFTNFDIHCDPVLIVYDRTWFVHLKGHHYRFITRENRQKSVLAVIPVCPTTRKKRRQP